MTKIGRFSANHTSRLYGLIARTLKSTAYAPKSMSGNFEVFVISISVALYVLRSGVTKAPPTIGSAAGLSLFLASNSLAGPPLVKMAINEDAVEEDLGGALRISDCTRLLIGELPGGHLTALELPAPFGDPHPPSCQLIWTLSADPHPPNSVRGSPRRVRSTRCSSDPGDSA